VKPPQHQRETFPAQLIQRLVLIRGRDEQRPVDTTGEIRIGLTPKEGAVEGPRQRKNTHKSGFGTKKLGFLGKEIKSPSENIAGVLGKGKGSKEKRSTESALWRRAGRYAERKVQH